ncbi:hypothetical protein RhiJN_19184 [Ceratobasidium sp. AG-Ba]|nr:hypothetical protein RhiJN_19184 [Ceratobasidium sp. AG-Ba]
MTTVWGLFQRISSHHRYVHFIGGGQMAQTKVGSYPRHLLRIMMKSQNSGLVMLLPHGLDGAGPEHSSARIERFLQVKSILRFIPGHVIDLFINFKLTNDAYEFDPKLNINMHVVNPTTPAQYFHLLRRQMLRNYRKPLIVAAPKGLLRSPAAACTLADMEVGTEFQPVLADPSLPSGATKDRVLVVCGKIYYDLVRERKARGLDDSVAIVRVEEIAPFPFVAFEEVLQNCTAPGADVRWVQEEPKNQGAWSHVQIGSRGFWRSWIADILWHTLVVARAQCQPSA